MNMAIEKMQKFNLITFYNNQDAVMEQLQDFQQVELFSASQFNKQANAFLVRCKNILKLTKLKIKSVM